MDTDTIALNLAYVAYVSASLFPGGLTFRLALVAQSFVFIAWGIIADNVTAIIWNVLFAAVNAWQAIRIARRDSVRLSDEEEHVRRTLFETLSRRDFLLLWSTGRESSGPVGEQLCVEGAENVDLVLLLAGDVDVVTSTGLERRRSPLTFIGEMSFFSREPASADVVASTPIRFRRWNQDDLRNLQKLNGDCSTALQVALGRDVTNKLRT